MKLYCSECGKEYESGKFCPECGVKLQECSAMLQELAPDVVCPNCGIKVESSKFCPECGANLDDTSSVAFFELNTAKEVDSYLQESEKMKGGDSIDSIPDSINEYSSLIEEANMGSTAALIKLVNLCSRGVGVHQNDKEIVELYHKAAVKGYALAQYNLGLCYATGRGIKKNNEQAVRWYRNAAEQGNADAKKNLDLMYYYGLVEGSSKYKR